MSFAGEERGMQILAGAYAAGATFGGKEVAIDAAVAKMAQPVDASEARELLMVLENEDAGLFKLSHDRQRISLTARGIAEVRRFVSQPEPETF